MVTEVTEGGSGGWTGKGYTEIPYLKNQRIAVELNSAVVNDCTTGLAFQLVSGTVVSAYDPAWSGVRSVDQAIDQLKELTTQLIDLYSTYTGTTNQQTAIRDINAKLCQSISTNNKLTAEQKAQLTALCQSYQTESETFLTCSAPAPTTNAISGKATARLAAAPSCTATEATVGTKLNLLQVTSTNFATLSNEPPADLLAEKKGITVGADKRTLVLYNGQLTIVFKEDIDFQNGTLYYFDKVTKDRIDYLIVENKKTGQFMGFYRVAYLTDPPPTPCKLTGLKIEL